MEGTYTGDALDEVLRVLIRNGTLKNTLDGREEARRVQLDLVPLWIRIVVHKPLQSPSAFPTPVNVAWATDLVIS